MADASGDLALSYWSRVLVERKFPGNDDRRQALCRLLVDSELSDHEQLSEAEHPRHWLNAESCSPVEIKFLWSLRKGPRPRSRWACAECVWSHVHARPSVPGRGQS